MIVFFNSNRRSTNLRELILNCWNSSKMQRLTLPLLRKKSPACNSVSTSPSEVTRSTVRWRTSWTTTPIAPNSESCSSVKSEPRASTISDQRKSRLLSTGKRSKLELGAATLTSMSLSISTHRLKSTSSIEAAQLGNWRQMVLRQQWRHLKDSPKCRSKTPNTVQIRDPSNFETNRIMIQNMRRKMTINDSSQMKAKTNNIERFYEEWNILIL